MRIHQVARKYGINNKDILQYLETIGMPGKSHSSSLDDGTLELLLQHFGKLAPEQKETQAKPTKRFAKIRRPKNWREQPAETKTTARASEAGASAQTQTPVAEPEKQPPAPPAAAATETVEPPQPTEPQAKEPYKPPMKETPAEEVPPPPTAQQTVEPAPEEETKPLQETQSKEKSQAEGKKKSASKQAKAKAAKKREKLKTITLAPQAETPAQPEIIIEAPEVDESKLEGDQTAATDSAKFETETRSRDEQDQVIRREIQKLKQKQQRRVTEEEQAKDKTAKTPERPGPRRPTSGPGSSRGKRAWKREKRERRESQIVAEQKRQEREATVLKVHEATTVADIADGLGVSPNELITKLVSLGLMVTINQRLDMDTIQIIAEEYGFQVEKVDVMESDLVAQLNEDDVDPERLEIRPPVVTIMGHVDHGKTKLLDAVRSTDVVSQEAGGITQHIGAYYVKTPQGSLVFLDTPGHEAFTTMRARGAMVTDIVVLVVSATEGVKPQTIEAIHHAKAADVPIIVAMNKIDLEGADTNRVKQELSQHGLITEDWGGDLVCVPVSAKSHIGIKDLIEAILLQSELLELKADPGCRARGTIIESRLEQGRGSVATVLIQQGTLRLGDPFVTGVTSGRVRALSNERGEELEVAGPAQPVEIIGMSDVPSAGDPFIVVQDDAQAKNISTRLQQIQRERELKRQRKVTLEDLHRQIEEGEMKELQIIVKGDVQGSVDAVCSNLLKIESSKVRVEILHSAVGAITESDVMLASASNALIIGFNVRPAPDVRDLAKREMVDIRTYQIIYEAIEDVRKAMTGMLDMQYRERELGHAEIREVFKLGRGLSIAGCYVQDGVLIRNSKCRLLRDSVIIHEGKLDSLKRFKEDAKEVKAGAECGIGLENFSDLRVGDVVECYDMEEVAPSL